MTTSKDRRVCNRRHFDRDSGTFQMLTTGAARAMMNFGILPLSRKLLVGGCKHAAPCLFAWRLCSIWDVRQRIPTLLS